MNVRDTIIKIIEEELGVDPGTFSDTSKLVDDLGADSPHLLELAMALEEQFGIEVSDTELATLHTVGDVVTYVAGKPAGGRP